MTRAALPLAFAVCLYAADKGIRPLRMAAEYPVFHAEQGFSMGAKLLTPQDVQSTFASDLNRGAYLVVEVAVFPKEGQTLDVKPSDFTLVEKATLVRVRPGFPRAIAATIQKANASDREVTLYPTAGVGYESGPGYDDPVYGRRRGGVNKSVGVGVGLGNSKEGATPADRRAMEAELAEQEIPEGAAAKPVAGYLYFPFDLKKNKKATLELHFTPASRAESVKLELGAPARR